MVEKLLWLQKMYWGMLRIRAHTIHQPHSRNKEGTHTLGISPSRNARHGERKINSKGYPRALILDRECKSSPPRKILEKKK